VPGPLTDPAWSITEWVAVLAVAAGPEELAGEVETLVELDPEGADVHPGWWFCGVAGDDRNRLEEAARRIGSVLGHPPLIRGPFRLVRLAD
jgi:hypothetical protein